MKSSSKLCQRARGVQALVLGKAQRPVKIVIASKYAGSSQLNELISCGFKTFGENRVQDLIKKDEEAPGALWHFIGHLQTNKVKYLIGKVELIQSVDSLRLAKVIDSQSAKRRLIQDILIQVNVAEEPNKYGILPEGLDFLVDEIIKLNNIRVRGLMAIMPLAQPESLRPYFKKLKQLFEDLKRELPNQAEFLSAGMTNDWEVALQEGANMLRLGSVIFGG